MALIDISNKQVAVIQKFELPFKKSKNLFQLGAGMGSVINNPGIDRKEIFGAGIVLLALPI